MIHYVNLDEVIDVSEAIRAGFNCGTFEAGCSIVSVLFTASSVRVDRRGTCSIGSKAAAARGYAGSHRRCRARSLGAI